MHTVSLDVSGAVKQLQPFARKEALDDLLQTIVYVGRSIWTKAVSGEVYEPMTGPIISHRYANAIWDPANESRDDEYSITISIASFEGASSIEEGYEAFNMKAGLLRDKNGKVKHSKSGTAYIDVPFRHGTPSSQAVNERNTFASTMPQSVYKTAKQLTANTGQQLVDPDGPTVTKPKVGKMSNPYTHKGKSIYNNMQKKNDGAGNKYLTWRRVSENSDPDSWWHPGADGQPISEAVALEVAKLAPDIVQAWYESHL